MNRFQRLLAGAILALGAAPAAHAGVFQVVVNGQGQHGEGPLAPVIITWDLAGSNPFVSYSARYAWDSRLTLVGLSGGGVQCVPSGTSIEIVALPFVSTGNCQLVLVPSFPQPAANVQINPISCNAGGPCVPGIYQVLAPSFSPDLPVKTEFTLSGVVGGPSPTRVIRISNFGSAGSVLRLTPAIDAPATISPATASQHGQGGFRDFTIACPTVSALLARREIRFTHNASHQTATPATYGVTCDIRTPPTLVYDPPVATPIAIPATNALSVTREIKISTSGGQAGGSRALSCAALAGYSISVATSPFPTGSTGLIRLGCDASPVPPDGTLSCTETPGSVRTWPVSCDSRPAFTATPDLATPVVLNGLVGGPDQTATFTVRNTGTESTNLVVQPATGLSGGLSVTPSTQQTIPQGTAGVTYTVTCSAAAAFAGTQVLSLVHSAAGSPALLSVTCNMRTPPTLQYSPSFGTGVQVSASVGAASTSTPIVVTTVGGDPGGARSLTCSAPSNYSVVVDQSPFATGSAGAIRVGCDSINTAPGQLTCTESPVAVQRIWNLTCANNAIYGSTPRPSSTVGVYSAIGETGFVSADVALTNSGTAPLSITGCVQAPLPPFGQSIFPNPITTTGTMNISCQTPPVGTVVIRTLSCATNDPTRPSVIYKLVCVAPPLTDPGEGASPGERLTSPSPDGGALLGSSTVIAEGPNGEEIVVVGAPNGGGDGDGRVYVYVRQRAGGAGALADAKDKPPGRGLGKPVAVLRAPANRGKVHAKGIGNKFGEDVAISNDGTLIAVGAPTGGGANTGEVLVFTMPPGGWDDLGDLVPVVVAPPAEPGVVAAGFGSHVEFSPEGTLVVGAPGAIVSAVDNAGAAFMFEPDGTPVGAPITATSPEPGAAFGTSLDVSTGMLAVGAPGENNSTGAAYFFEIDAASAVGPANRQTAPGGSFGDKWGTEVVIGGASIIVGAPNDDTAAGQDSGSATVFLQGQGNAVNFAATLIPPAGGTQGAGAAIASNGDVVVLGAPLSDIGGNTDRGRAIVFDLEAAAVGVGVPAGVYENTIGEAGDQFGSAIGISRGRLLLGAPLSDEGPDVDEGRVDPFDLDRIFRGNFEF